MFLSHWLKCLGRQGRYSRRTSAARHSFRPTLEALETRDVPTVSFASAPWPPSPPPITQLLREMAATPFAASSDGERPLTHKQALAASAGSGNPTVFVQNGQSIQAALDAAGAGTTIYIDPGVYQEHLHVHTAGVHLVGLVGTDGGHVTLVNPGQSGDGVQVDTSGGGFVMRFLEVRGFRDGVNLDHVENFRLTHLLLTDNSGSGIVTTSAAHGVVQYTEEHGSAAAGIELENSDDVVVQYNRTHANVVGVEVVNSTDVDVVRNAVFDNTAGIVAAQLPGGSSAGDLIVENYVSGNNHRNFAAAGSAESYAVQGTGVVLLGAAQTTVRGNLVIGNQTMGVGVVSAAQLPAAFTTPSAGSHDVDLSANNNTVADNWVMGNGFHSMTPQLPHGVDLLWDGRGQGNHWTNNVSATSNPGTLPN